MTKENTHLLYGSFTLTISANMLSVIYPTLLLRLYTIISVVFSVYGQSILTLTAHNPFGFVVNQSRSFCFHNVHLKHQTYKVHNTTLYYAPT